MIGKTNACNFDGTFTAEVYNSTRRTCNAQYGDGDIVKHVTLPPFERAMLELKDGDVVLIDGIANSNRFLEDCSGLRNETTFAISAKCLKNSGMVTINEDY